jgi:hypothetical protein
MVTMVIKFIESVTDNEIAEIDCHICPRVGEIIRVLCEQGEKAYRVERIWHQVAKEQRVTVERGEPKYTYVRPTCLCSDVTREYVCEREGCEEND